MVVAALVEGWIWRRRERWCWRRERQGLTVVASSWCVYARHLQAPPPTHLGTPLLVDGLTRWRWGGVPTPPCRSAVPSQRQLTPPPVAYPPLGPAPSPACGANPSPRSARVRGGGAPAEPREKKMLHFCTAQYITQHAHRRARNNADASKISVVPLYALKTCRLCHRPPRPPSRWQIIAQVEECAPPSVSGWQAGLERHAGARLAGREPPSWTVRRVFCNRELAAAPTPPRPPLRSLFKKHYSQKKRKRHSARHRIRPWAREGMLKQLPWRTGPSNMTRH